MALNQIFKEQGAVVLYENYHLALGVVFDVEVGSAVVMFRTFELADAFYELAIRAEEIF